MSSILGGYRPHFPPKKGFVEMLAGALAQLAPLRLQTARIYCSQSRCLLAGIGGAGGISSTLNLGTPISRQGAVASISYGLLPGRSRPRVARGLNLLSCSDDG